MPVSRLEGTDLKLKICRNTKQQSNNNNSNGRNEERNIDSGRFKIVRWIGKGSFAKVGVAVSQNMYSCFDNNSNNGSIVDDDDATTLAYSDEMKVAMFNKDLSAVKVVEKGKHVKLENAIKSELQVLSHNGGLHHPFIIGFKFAYETSRHFYLGLEYCPGSDLHTLMCKVDCFSMESIRYYSSQLVLALEYLHSQRIVYGDLKPENITIAIDGTLRLIDFGLSVILEEGVEQVKTESGTLPYVAPEILCRKPHGVETDWWSLGVMIYELAFGVLPWYSDDAHEQCRLICKEPLRPPPDLEQNEHACYLLLSRLLRKSRATRITDPEEIKSHVFFQNMDWELVYNGCYNAPFVPKLDSITDTKHFHKEFTNLPVGPTPQQQ